MPIEQTDHGEGEESDGHGLRPITYPWTNARIQTAGTLVTAGAEVFEQAIETLKLAIKAQREQEEYRRLAHEAVVTENRV